MGTCPTGKLAYASPQLAYAAARKLAGRKHQQQGTVYRCKFANCKQWHISSMKQQQGKGSPKDLPFGWWRKH